MAYLGGTFAVCTISGGVQCLRTVEEHHLGFGLLAAAAAVVVVVVVVIVVVIIIIVVVVVVVDVTVGLGFCAGLLAVGKSLIKS